VRVVKDLRVGVDRAPRHLCGIEFFHPVRGRGGGKHFFDFGFQFVDVFQP
jgi:hypothetical protein